MRCKNCGWPNKPNETVCTKCGSPLDMEPSGSDYNDGFNSPSSSYNDNGDGLKKTILEPGGIGSFDNNPQEQRKPTNIVSEEITCPKCGYPLREDTVKCPNCNFQVGDGHDTHSLNNDTNGYKRRPTRMADSPIQQKVQQREEEEPRIIQNAGKFRGTVNPYMMSVPQDPMCILNPIQRMNERKVPEAFELELANGEVVLTRDNTEPGNPSITSKAQAVISHTEGHWYIENCSEQQTTFVLAKDKIELHNGDIILLGNRMFEFTEQK